MQKSLKLVVVIIPLLFGLLLLHSITNVSLSQTANQHIAYNGLVSFDNSSAATFDNNSNIVEQLFYESGLPAGAYWTVNYFGANSSALSGSPILFEIPYGTYSTIFYDYVVTADNSTTNCTISYIPANFVPNSPALITAGSRITVNYNNYKEICVSRQGAVNETAPLASSSITNLPIDWNSLLLAVMVLAIVISVVILGLVFMVIFVYPNRLRKTEPVLVKQAVPRAKKRKSGNKKSKNGGVVID